MKVKAKAPSDISHYTVEPLNKGHVGNKINSLVLSFVERLFLFSEVVNVLKV